MTIKEMFDEARRICERLEKGDVGLEESLTLYAKGIEIQARIEAELKSAERRVVEIINPDGSIEPFEIPAKR